MSTPSPTQQEPDVLARLLSLLQNWADSHRGRPRVALDLWTDPAEDIATAAVLMGCVYWYLRG